MTEIEFMQEFGKNLKEELDVAGLSQKELSDETGISESTISYYIKGERAPSLKNVINIALALDCDIDDLTDVTDKII